MEDKISALPDSLIHHILSLLPSTSDAIGTSLLSKRWQYLWSTLPVLIFNQYSDTNTKTDDSIEFAQKIDATLSHHSCSKLKKFVVKIESISDNGMHYAHIQNRVQTWVCFAVERQVEELTIFTVFDYCGFHDHSCIDLDDFCCVLPLSLYSNRHLRILKTKVCYFPPTDRKVEWSSLRVLSVDFARLSDKIIKAILHGSPLLHSLKFHRCSGLNQIHSPRHSCLKVLSVSEMSSFGQDRLEITAPGIEVLELLGCWHITKCILGTITMPNLVSARIEFGLDSQVDDLYCESGEIVLSIFQNIRYAREVKVGCWCIQVLSRLRMEELTYTLWNCKYLTLDVRCFDNGALPGIATLLQTCRNIEKLCLGSMDYCCCDDSDTMHWENLSESWKKMEKTTFECLLTHLKKIEIFHISNFKIAETIELIDFIRFLFVKAEVLQTVDIYGTIDDNKVCMARQMLNFPRESVRSVIVFHNPCHRRHI